MIRASTSQGLLVIWTLSLGFLVLQNTGLLSIAIMLLYIGAVLSLWVFAMLSVDQMLARYCGNQLCYAVILPLALC